jgi:hypothetical protein
MSWRLVLALLLVSGVASAQQPEWKSAEHVSTRIPREVLDAISVRGRAIANYDAAAWHGTDAVRALHPAAGAVRQYVARQRPGLATWEVVFGRLSANADTFYIAYRATQASANSQVFAAAAVTPVQGDTGYFARAARALDVAARDFGRASRPYNTVVLPTGLEWYVYLIPTDPRPIRRMRHWRPASTQPSLPMNLKTRMSFWC